MKRNLIKFVFLLGFFQLMTLTTGCKTYFLGGSEFCKKFKDDVLCVKGGDQEPTSRPSNPGNTGGDTCKTDDDCSAGNGCHTGVCRPFCRTEKDCRGLKVACSCEESLCVPKADPPKPQACKVDQDCTGGLVCLDAVCKKPECTTDTVCARGSICTNHKCTTGCREDNDCPTALRCMEARCVTACRVSCECPKGNVCSDKGVCQKAEVKVHTCKVDCECPSGLHCQANGTCG